MELNDLEIDESAAEGKWFPFENARFKIAYFDRADFARASAKAYKDIPDHVVKADAAMGKVRVIKIMAESVLLDWEGVTQNGKPIPATLANRILLLGKHVALRDWVSETGRELENFKAEAEAGDAATLKSIDRVGDKMGE